VPELQEIIEQGGITMEKVEAKIKKYYENEFRNNSIAFHNPKNNRRRNWLRISEKKFKARIDVQQELIDVVFKDEKAKWIRIAGNSIGGVQIGTGITILCKPKDRASGGIKNEGVLINTINDHAKGSGKHGINVSFQTGFGERPTKQFIVKNVVEAKGVGTQTAGRKKSDCDLILANGDVVPISIKQDDAAFWESVESWFYPDALRYKGGDSIMEAAEEAGIIARIGIPGGLYNLVKGRELTTSNIPQKVNIAMKVNSKLSKEVMFGSDIEELNGAIVVRTFLRPDFKWNNSGSHLMVNCSKIIKGSDQQLPEAWFLFMNTMSRGKNSNFAPGVRIVVATPKRAKSAVKIKWYGNMVRRT